MIEIIAPKNIGNDVDGGNFLSLFFEKSNEKDDEIVVDFKNTRWVRANLSSILGAICWNAWMNNTKVIFQNLNPSIKRIFSKNHFYKNFGVEPIKDEHNSTIKYREFAPEEKTAFSIYVREEFIPSIGIEFNKKFEQKFRTAIEELFQNCRLHGMCNKIFVCGQYFPSEKRLYFTITNLGVTIKENIEKRYEDYIISAESAIIWATKKGNTTRLEENIGGIGLDFLITFLDDTKGKIHIISDEASYEREKRLIRTYKMENKFLGTMVTLIFSVNDICKKYDEEDYFDRIEVLENFF